MARYCKGGFKSEDTGGILLLQNKYSNSLSWAKNLNKLFTDLGGKFKFSAQDSDLEYLSWRCKNPPVSSDLKPPLAKHKGRVKTKKPLKWTKLAFKKWVKNIHAEAYNGACTIFWVANSFIKKAKI